MLTDRHGFTLMELMMVVAILAVISVLGIAALQTSGTALATASTKSLVQDNLRDVVASMKRELQLASKTPDDSLLPPLQAVAVNANPAPNCATEIVFQTPTDNTALRWTDPIRFRYYNEDANGNGILDAGEDSDGDGTLSRRILRLEDLDGDGDTNDPGEQTVVAGANNISDVQFVLNNNIVTITVTSQKLQGFDTSHPITATVTSDIYLQN
ncbi:MAG: prepilin-type N-terminal cleavage/methylation domain-containing protein [Candidatus Hydrogenedentes bacterium]|nr:prepilin-type N-terminal cleavage/methylation domain-containing protein [Candidatus Hydrogenedentota bacterium]